MDSDVRNALRTAADLIEEEGWTQGVLSNDVGEMCALGGLSHAVRQLGADDVISLYYRAKHTLDLRLVESGERFGMEPIVEWNDKAGQTMENVVGTLRRLAADGR